MLVWWEHVARCRLMFSTFGAVSLNRILCPPLPRQPPHQGITTRTNLIHPDYLHGQVRALLVEPFIRRGLSNWCCLRLSKGAQHVSKATTSCHWLMGAPINSGMLPHPLHCLLGPFSVQPCMFFYLLCHVLLEDHDMWEGKQNRNLRPSLSRQLPHRKHWSASTLYWNQEKGNFLGCSKVGSHQTVVPANLEYCDDVVSLINFLLGV